MEALWWVNTPVYPFTEGSLPEEVEWATRNQIEPVPDTTDFMPRAQLMDYREVRTWEIQDPDEPPSQVHIVRQHRAHLYSSRLPRKTFSTKQEVVASSPSCPNTYTEWLQQMSKEESGPMDKGDQ